MTHTTARRTPASRPVPPAAALVLALLALLLPGARALGEAIALGKSTPHETWYVLEIQGRRSGWMYDSLRIEGDGADRRLITRNRLEMLVKRGETELRFAIGSEFVETPEGEPVSMVVDNELGGVPTRETFEWREDGTVFRTATRGEDTVKGNSPQPRGEWFTPAHAVRTLLEQIEAGAERVKLRVIDPTNGLAPIETTRSGFEETTVEVLGRTVPAIRCAAVTSVQPHSTTAEYLDPISGKTLRAEYNLGALPIVVLAADEALARSPLEPAELLRSAFVRPDRRLEAPYELESAAYRLSIPDGVLPDLPAGGRQSVERVDERTAVVRLNLDATPERADTEDAELLAASLMVDTRDEAVTRLASRALAGVEGGPAEKAEALRRFVHRFINRKDLAVGYATASEVARSGQGDCTEHAVLLAALLRASGIPSRAVSGLIYAEWFAEREDIFGYHMWTQAVLPGPDGTPVWVDLDAVMPPETPVSATHIALATTDLSDDERLNAMVELGPLLGTLRIEVLSPDAD